MRLRLRILPVMIPGTEVPGRLVLRCRCFSRLSGSCVDDSGAPLLIIRLLASSFKRGFFFPDFPAFCVVMLTVTRYDMLFRRRMCSRIVFIICFGMIRFITLRRVIVAIVIRAVGKRRIAVRTIILRRTIVAGTHNCLENTIGNYR